MTTKLTHAEGCWSWGPEHYLCAYAYIKRLEQPLTIESIEDLWKQCKLSGSAPIGFVRLVEKSHVLSALPKNDEEQSP